MRDKQTIKAMLIRSVKGREVMTASEFAKAWGYKTTSYAKEKYLADLDEYDGRYLIDDIAERLTRGQTQ